MIGPVQMSVTSCLCAETNGECSSVGYEFMCNSFIFVSFICYGPSRVVCLLWSVYFLHR